MISVSVYYNSVLAYYKISVSFVKRRVVDQLEMEGRQLPLPLIVVYYLK